MSDYFRCGICSGTGQSRTCTYVATNMKLFNAKCPKAYNPLCSTNVNAYLAAITVCNLALFSGNEEVVS